MLVLGVRNGSGQTRGEIPNIFFDKIGQNWWYFVVSGWGLGLLSHFIGITSTSLFSVEKEVERLKKDSKNRY